RFDGVRNVVWQPPRGQQLPSNTIYGLLAAWDGTLWIGTANGLASWKDGNLTHYSELDGKYVFGIVEDHNRNIWASGVSATLGKLCAIRDGNVQCYGDDGMLGRGAFNLYVDSKGSLWAGVKNGLWRWTPGSPKFYQLPGEHNGIQSLGEDADGRLLVGWKGGIYQFVDGRTTLVYTLPRTAPLLETHRLLRDRDGDLWIGTSLYGLLHVHQGKMDAFRQADGLSGNSIQKLFQDREGSIWVATYDGLDRFRDLAVGTYTTKEG